MVAQSRTVNLPEHVQKQLSGFKMTDYLLYRLNRYFRSVSYNTARTYLHWMTKWIKWYKNARQSAEHSHWPTEAFPVPPYALVIFLEVIKTELSLGSLQSCIRALNSISVKALDYPSVISADVRFILKGVTHRETRQNVVTQQAIPFRLKDLKDLIALHGHSESVRVTRDLAMLWLGFETLLRSSEIRRVRMGDLMLQIKEGHQSFILSVYRTKTSTRTLITYQLSPQLSALLLRLMNRVGQNNRSTPHAYIFQPTDYHGLKYLPENATRRSQGRNTDRLLQGHNLAAVINSGAGDDENEVDDKGIIANNTLLRAFEWLWLSLNPEIKALDKGHGMRYQCWTGHSVRVGGAQALSQDGFSLPQIMEMGNWTSEEMVLRYIRNTQAKDKAMTRYIAGKL